MIESRIVILFEFIPNHKKNIFHAM